MALDVTRKPAQARGFRTWGQSRSSKRKSWAGPSAAADTAEGPSADEVCVELRKKSVPLSQSLPRLSGIRKTRTSGDAAEVRETPRLKVDRLKGNVFVNQYLIIKDLGRGAHGTVKLVFDTEEQVAYAMKVIHRKNARHQRRYSYSAGSPFTDSPAYSGSPSVGPGSLVHANTISADGCLQAIRGAGPTLGSSPFAASALLGGPLHPLASASGTHHSSNEGGGSQHASSVVSDQHLQHVIEGQGSRVASTVGFYSSPGMLQRSGSSAPQHKQLEHNPSVSDFLLPVEEAPQSAVQSPSQIVTAEPRDCHLRPATADDASWEGGNGDGVVTLIASSTNHTSADQKQDIATAASLTGPVPEQPQQDPPLATLSAAALQQVASHRQQHHAGHLQHLSLDMSVNRTGSGGMGSFSNGVLNSPMPVAVMVADAQTEQLMREMAVMKKLDHPHVVALHEVIHDPDAKVLIMVMEFMPGGPLLSSAGHGMTEPLPETAARNYFRELVSGLGYLHFNLIVHGDLKPDNLLLSAEGQLKISDFGSATVLPSIDSLVTSTPGTPAFMAPEMCGFKSTPYKPFPAECWALGVCLYMLVFGKVPYSASSTGILYEFIRSAQPVEFPQLPAVSDELKKLLQELLDKHPDTRSTLEQVSCHDWVTDHGRLQPVRRCCQQSGTGGVSPVGGAVSKVDQRNAITRLKQQVKEAIPSVEERTYRKGQILVEQGRVPEGLFLILHGECELVISTYLQEPDSPAAAIRVQQSGPSLAAIKKDSDIDFAAHLSSSSCSDESDRDTQEESEENASYSPLARSMRLPDILYVSQAAHVVDEASAVRAGLLLMDEAPTLSAQLQEQLTAALEHPFPLAATADEANNGTDQAAAATAGLAARDVLSVEQILPQLLPQPRWPGLPVIQSDCGSGSPSLSGIDVGSSRQASKSAGPVMLGAAADGADTSLPGQEGAANAAAAASPGSSSPRIPFGYSRARQKSMSFDTSHTGMPSNYSPTASVGWAAMYSQESLPSSSASPPRSPSPAAAGGFYRSQNLAQASAPDLRQLLHSHRSFLLETISRPGSAGPTFGGDGRPHSPGSPTGLFLQRSASSASVGKVFNRALRRTESMHKRMKLLVDQAKMITEHNAKRQELLGVRGPGQVIGDTSLGSRAVLATATVRARTRMKVLMVRRADAAALKHQPLVKAALYRTQTDSSVLEALEHFATYDGEVTTIDELRKSLAAASQSFSLAQLAASFNLARGQSPAAGGSPMATLGELSAASSYAGAPGLQAGLVGRSPGIAATNSDGSLLGMPVNGSPLLGYSAAPSTGPGGRYCAGSISAPLLPASRDNSFSAAAAAAATAAAAAAALSGQSSMDCSPVLGSPRRSMTPPGPYGLGGSSSHLMGVGGSVLSSRVSSSTRFALSAANGSQPHSVQLSPMPSATAAALATAAGAAKQPSQHRLMAR